MRKQVRFITYAAIIAAIYILLMVLFRPISFGAVQVRVAEGLTVLPFFTPAAIPGLAVGCLLGNFLGGADVFDIIFGTVATIIGAFGSYFLRRHRYLVPVPPIVANTLIIPFVLSYAYGVERSVGVLMLFVGGGEILSCGVIGIGLMLTLNKYRSYIFK